MKANVRGLLSMLALALCVPAYTASIPVKEFIQSSVRPDLYDGSANSKIIRAVEFRQLKHEMASRAGITPLAAPHPSIETIREPNEIELALLHGVCRFPVTRITGRGKEVVEIHEYDIAAAAPLKDVTYRGENIRFVLPSANIYRSLSGSRDIAAIQVDFDDGGGWAPLAPDVAASASYAETGTKAIVFRIEYEDGSSAVARSQLNVKALVTPSPDETIPIAASKPYLGALGSGTAYVYKSGAHTGLRTPVIIAEGFDIDNSMNWDELYNLLNQENLVETLRGYGRDLIVVNFADSTTYIQRNAYLLQAVLEYVATNRVDAADKLTLIGASMGGLVSRYALLDHESTGAVHGVHTWLSFDAPHTGANIPLGVQHFVRFYAGIPESYRPAAAVEFLDALNSPAARQMLLVHLGQTNTVARPDPLFDALQQEFVNLGSYPAQPKRITIANGSGTGVRQAYLPGEKVIDYDYNILIAHLRGDVYALNVSAGVVFDGIFSVIFVGNESESVTRSSAFSYDNAPGGTRATFSQLDEVDPGYGDIVALYPGHCFIPTISALGMTSYSLLHSNLNAIAGLSGSVPFDEYHFAVTNEEHVLISASNAPWVIRAVLADYDTDGDGSDDYTEWYTGSDYTNAGSSVETTLIAVGNPPSAVELSWRMRRNVRYDVEKAVDVDGVWSNLFTTPILTTNGPASYMYPVAVEPSETSVFYRLTGEPVDPHE